MRICISGLTASGKTTLGGMVARELRIAHVTKQMTPTYRELMKNTKLSPEKRLIETANPLYARRFDREIVRIANGSDCVVSTWLGPWLIRRPTLRVWLDAGLDERAQRYAERDHLGFEAARRTIQRKDSMSIKSFKSVQKINILDRTGIFDIEINTGRVPLREAAATISMLALLREKNKR